MDMITDENTPPPSASNNSRPIDGTWVVNQLKDMNVSISKNMQNIEMDKEIIECFQQIFYEVPTTYT
jgi:hypothetical protein